MHLRAISRRHGRLHGSPFYQNHSEESPRTRYLNKPPHRSSPLGPLPISLLGLLHTRDQLTNPQILQLLYAFLWIVPVIEHSILELSHRIVVPGPQTLRLQKIAHRVETLSQSQIGLTAVHQYPRQDGFAETNDVRAVYLEVPQHKDVRAVLDGGLVVFVEELRLLQSHR